MILSSRRVCWDVHERSRKSGRTACVSVGLCDKGEPDFFVRGDFFCNSFVWQTKE